MPHLFRCGRVSTPKDRPLYNLEVSALLPVGQFTLKQGPVFRYFIIVIEVIQQLIEVHVCLVCFG